LALYLLAADLMTEHALNITARHAVFFEVMDSIYASFHAHRDNLQAAWPVCGVPYCLVCVARALSDADVWKC
jgi:hypothetical protein